MTEMAVTLQALRSVPQEAVDRHYRGPRGPYWTAAKAEAQHQTRLRALTEQIGVSVDEIIRRSLSLERAKGGE